jgi:SAM-dependent methyltransferase
MPDPLANGSAYQFGDSELAAERLRRLAEVFAPSSRSFLQNLTPAEPRAVLDLGCGPGHTARLLAEVFPGADVLGLDSSAAFVELARQQSGDRLQFAVGDATQTLPGGPYDLIYCRYLLTHLSEPVAAIAVWSAALRPGGLLAIEENEWIRTEVPALAHYLAIVESMLASAGQRLFVGAELARIEQWPLLDTRSSAVAEVTVGARAAAAMFLPNLATWRSRPFVVANYARHELDGLKAQLESIVDGSNGDGTITFGQRRLVLARRHP